MSRKNSNAGTERPRRAHFKEGESLSPSHVSYERSADKVSREGRRETNTYFLRSRIERS